MGKISEIYYEEVDPAIIDPEFTGEYYYYFNLAKVSDELQEEFIMYEDNQTILKNKIFGLAKKRNDISYSSKLCNAMFAISSLKNKVVLITDP
jgi:hypothetical protein